MVYMIYMRLDFEAYKPNQGGGGVVFYFLKTAFIAHINRFIAKL